MIFDVTIVGAGSAGLSAALALSRARRKVLVLNGGAPRNAPADVSHNFFTRDGTPPAELVKIGLEQLEPYGTEIQSRNAESIMKIKDVFELTLDNRQRVGSRRIILATGVVDILPDIPGFRELWGKNIHHCPYCHGWEVRDRPLAVYAKGKMGYQFAIMIRHWSKDLVVCSNGDAEFSDEQRLHLKQLNLKLIETPIDKLETSDQGLKAIVFRDGTALKREHIFMRPPHQQRSPLAAQLGCTMSEDGFYVKVNSNGETSVPGVYAAGDMTGQMQAVAQAAASGTMVGAMLNHALVFEEATQFEEARQKETV
jgi:thioredoxin reductase